jgi:hypothetical protein
MLRDEIANVLRSHFFERGEAGGWCTCTRWRASIEDKHPTFAEHVADEVMMVERTRIKPVLSDILRLTWAQGAPFKVGGEIDFDAWAEAVLENGWAAWSPTPEPTGRHRAMVGLEMRFDHRAPL